MKKLISVLLALTVLLSVLAVCAVSAGAETPANTIVDVKAGDEVVYYLKLSECSEAVVCADYSVYYDAAVLKVEAVADYTNSFDEEYHESIINTDINGEINANFIKIGKGIDFSKERTFIGVKFKAIADGKTHISYYIRDMAGATYVDTRTGPEMETFLFTCDVTVNGNSVLEEAQPELNTEEPQTIGSFVNSVTGKSADADYVASENDNGGNNGGSNNGGSSGNSGGSGNNSGSDNNPTSAPGSSDGGDPNPSDPQSGSDNASDSSTLPYDTSDGQKGGSGSDSGSSGGSSAWLWIVIIAVAILGGGGFAAYTILGKKKNKD